MIYLTDLIDHSPDFRNAHERATMWAKLGLVDNILTDTEIPKYLRDRIHRFVTGADVQPSFTLPLSSSNEWFEDPNDHSNFHRYIERLVARGWPDKAIQSIEESTRRVMNFLFDPRSDGSHQRYGLVMGRVQSGKTANYAGLISRAVDSGYDIIIVLAGLHNSLRKQTQIRLQDDIITQNPEAYSHRRLIPLTGEEVDFQTLPSAQLFNVSENNSVLLVLKKNVSPLTKLYEQLSQLDDQERWKLNLLIVDDEADHATINGKKIDSTGEQNLALDEYEDDDDDEEDEEISDATKINSRIRQILGLFTRYSYVGYTATPFANVLIDPDVDHPSLGPTLYPRTFIMALQKPDGHGGLEEFFPSDNEPSDNDLSNQVVAVPREEALALKDLDIGTEYGKESDLPPSLIDAIMDFYLTGAARTARESNSFNHTMLVHIKHTINNQSPIFSRIREVTNLWRERIPNIYSTHGRKLMESFRERWESEFAIHDSTTEDWKTIHDNLIKFTLDGVQTKLVNYKGDDLDYYRYSSEGLHVIAVGGNRLSRGLTLEGLCCTYFVRESRMYDTLTQMGRWFGFRPGYSDLVRLHTTGLLVEWFTWLTSVERAIISDIDRYSQTGKSPSDLAVRILKHRTMLPTSKNKMQHARLFTGSLSASTPRMTRFLFHDPPSLKQNLQNVSDFIQSLESDPEKPKGDETLLWREIEPERILSLVQGHLHNPEDRTFDAETVELYIKSRLEIDELSTWSVALISSKDGRIDRPMEIYGTPIQVSLPSRTRIKGGDSIGELIQPSNIVIDLPGTVSEYSVNGQVSYPLMYRNRSPNNPLLLIYIIDPYSTPKNSNHGSRMPLFLPHEEKVPVVGLAMALPVSEDEQKNNEKQISEFWALEGIDHGV